MFRRGGFALVVLCAQALASEALARIAPAELLFEFGSCHRCDGEFLDPLGRSAVAIDTMGRILVADNGNHRVQVFGADGDSFLRSGSLERTMSVRIPVAFRGRLESRSTVLIVSTWRTRGMGAYRFSR